MSMLDSMFSISQVSDRTLPVNIQVKLLLFGNSGAGKTALGCTAPNPLFLLSEENAIPTIRYHNPDAMIIKVKNTDDLSKILTEIESGGLKKTNIQTIVLDSATEFLRMKLDEYKQQKAGKNWENYQPTLQDHGFIVDYGRRMLRRVRDLPYNVVVLALAETKETEDGKTRVLPVLHGNKMPGEAMQFFSGAGYVFKKPVDASKPDGEVIHQVLFQGSSQFHVKPIRPLKSMEIHDISDWIKRINMPLEAQATSTTTEAAPQPESPPQTATATEAAPQAAQEKTAPPPSEDPAVGDKPKGRRFAD